MRLHSSRRAFALVAFALVNALDIATTHVALAAGLAEGNPLAAGLMQHGEPVVYAAKVALCALVAAVVIALPRYPRLWYSLAISSTLLAFVVALNFAQIVAL
jgi:hypothetical protein